MTEHGKDIVESYIQDLLADPDVPASAPPAQVPMAKIAVAAPKPHMATLKSHTKAGPDWATTAEQIHALEDSKRAELTRLLSSDLKVAAAPAPMEPIVHPVSAPEPPIPPPIKVRDTPNIAKPAALYESSLKEPEPSPLLQWAENGRPIWAQGQFDVLLFQVSGLNLAVPLVALGHIHPIADELASVFGQAEWFMGLLPTPAGQIRCVNTALFVMPERYNSEFLNTAKYIVSIDGMNWGLAVDHVRQPTRLHPDDVTWRSERSKRPWLAGTVKTAMCALIDIPQMGALLLQSEPKRTR